MLLVPSESGSEKMCLQSPAKNRQTVTKLNIKGSMTSDLRQGDIFYSSNPAYYTVWKAVEILKGQVWGGRLLLHPGGRGYIDSPRIYF